MLAIRVVQTLLGNPQIFHHTIIHHRLFNNPRDVFYSHVAVEDPLGVNRHGRAVFALFEAAGPVCPYQGAESTGFDLGFERAA